MKKIAIILTLAAVILQANSYTIEDKVRVTKSKPIYKTVTNRIPYQECWNEDVPVRKFRQSHRSSYARSSDPFGSLIGGVAGGILGNQVGKGRGKTVATIGGALIGTIVGHNLSNRGERRQRRDSYTSYESQQQCSTRYTETSEERFMGYKNIGHYKGKKIVKISQRKLRYIPIHIRINY